jgi:hypothetical protein
MLDAVRAASALPIINIDLVIYLFFMFYYFSRIHLYLS